MSNSDRLLLILHVGFAIFTLGPVTVATSATPRYIRRGDIAIVRYLHRGTRIYGLGALGIFLFGIFLAHGNFSKFWLSASMTLFIVAVFLLLIIEHDQRKALQKLEAAAAAAAESTAPAAAAVTDGGEGADVKAEEKPATEESPAAARTTTIEAQPARVETGRISTISGVVALIWLVILILMIWNAN